MDRRLAAAIVVVVLFFLAGRACRRPAYRYAASRITPRPNPTRHVTTYVPPPPPTPEDASSVFRRVLAAASPGSWVRTWDIPPVLAPGPRGSWDDFKAGSPAVLEEAGGYRLWYRGCHFLAEDYGCGVGLATSRDGVSWERSGSPVFVPTDPYQRGHLDRIAVARGGGGYVLWYSVSTSPAPERRRAKLYVARSPDGVTWTPQPEAVYEAVAQPAHLRPAALWREDRFHVWLIDSRFGVDPATGLFPEMPAEGDDVLLHFVSSDGAKLEAAGSTAIQPLLLDWQPLSIGPHGSGGFRALFYEQSPSGRESQGVNALLSKDGSIWERASSESMPLSVMDLDSHGAVSLSAALPAKGGLFAWFAIRTPNGGEAIRVGFHKEKA